MNTVQNKIPAFIGDQKLFDALSEIIVQINQQTNKKFDIVFYDQKTEVFNSTIIADKSAFKSLEKNNFNNYIKKIYLIDNSKDLKINKKIQCEIIK